MTGQAKQHGENKLTEPTETPEPTPETAPETASETTDFEPITSKEQMDKVIAAARRKDRAMIAELQIKAKKFDETEQAKKSQAEQAAERITLLETELATERQTRMRETLLRKVLREMELSDDAGEFIHGNDEDEMRASAERFKSLQGPAPKPKPNPKGLKTSFGADNRMDPKELAAAKMREFWRGTG